MKITIDKEEEIELTEREIDIFNQGEWDGLFKGTIIGFVSGIVIFFILYMLTK